MAKYLICAVHDAAVKAFNQPMFFRSREEAMRSFGDACRDPKNVAFSNHSHDYSLWHLGYFDDVGVIDTVSPDVIMKAIDCVPYDDRDANAATVDYIRGKVPLAANS